MSNINIEFNRPYMDEILHASKFPTATLHEASGKIGALPSCIKPLSAKMRICGPVVTIHSPPGDNIMLHEAIVAAQPGDVLVVDVSGHYEAGYWGDIMTHAAKYRKIQGLIINGCVRDSKEIIESEFPVFSRGICIKGTTKHGGGSINVPITIGDTVISPGDLVVGDGDGVVVLPRLEIGNILKKAEKRESQENLIIQQLNSGKTTMEIYGWKSQLNL